MSISAVTHKLKYYEKWLEEMPMGDLISWKGKWVKDRIDLLTEALAELHNQST